MSWVSKAFKRVKKAVKSTYSAIETPFHNAYSSVSKFGEEVGAAVGIHTDATDRARKEAEAKALKKKAATDAAEAAALVEEEQAGMKGTVDELEKLRRKKGFLVTLLGGSSSSYGLNTTPYKKTLGGT